jgi:hypothetical protein
VEPGCQLPLFKVNEERGIYDFNQEKEYSVEYRLTDAFGNQSVYSFRVVGRREQIPQTEPLNARWLLKWDRVNNIQFPGMQLTMGKHLLGRDVVLQPLVTRQPASLSDAYRLAPESMPVFDWAELRIRLNHEPSDTSKICIIGGIHEYPAIVRNGWAIAKIRDLGDTFEVGYPSE